MGMIIGPTPWWQANLVASLPVGGTLPDGSRISCKAGGTAWIIAPSTTEALMFWSTNYVAIDSPVSLCCVCEWSPLQTCLISRGFNPSDWFVPSNSVLQTAGYACRFFWDPSTIEYWSSEDAGSSIACSVQFNNGIPRTTIKAYNRRVRVFRCVTY